MKKVLKRIFIVILIIIIIILVWRLSLFIRAKILEDKIAANFQRDYYRKTSYETNNRTIEEWHGEKYSKISFNVENVEKHLGTTIDTWQDNENRVCISEQANKQMYVKYLRDGESDRIINTLFNSNPSMLTHVNLEDIKYSFTNGDILNALTQIFLAPFGVIDSITTEKINGKECYAVKEMYGLEGTIIYYIEKDTNLIIRLESSVQGNIAVTNYEYSFEPITKELLDFPNLEEYYVIVN